MPDRSWWQAPRLQTAGPASKERRVTWLELFYDLVFVVVVGQISHRLSADLSAAGIAEFVFLFIPTWWIWVAATYYVEYWETHDVSIRLIMFSLMLPVVGLAVFVHDALGETARGYAVCYALARLVLCVVFFRVGAHDRTSRAVAWSYATGFLAIAVLIALSVLVGPRVRIALWAMALAIEMLIPIMVTVSVSRVLPHRLTASKLPERFGLFTIIVLGETFVGIFGGLSGTHHFDSVTIVVGTLGLAMSFALFSLYFDFVAKRVPRDGIWNELAWGYAHLVLLMSVVVFAACLSHVVASGELALPDPVRRILAGAVGSAILLVGLVELTLRPDEVPRPGALASVGTKVVVAAAAATLGFVGGGFGAGWMLALLLAMTAVPIGMGFRAVHSGRGQP